MYLPRHSLVLACVLSVASCAHAQVPYNFSEVTAHCQDAVAGLNVEVPVRGFELILLKNGEVVYHRAFGQWTIGRAANADSATKTLSGALIMSLTEQSSLPFSLDSQLSQFIPAFNGSKQNITIRQCFSHTAGFAESQAVASRMLTLQQTAAWIAASTLAFAPGSTFAYGGTSMHAAGAAAELAAGIPWNTAFSQRITGPLGLTVTRFVLTSPANPRIAGGCESVGTEFARFMEMLRRGGEIDGTRVLTSASVQAMFTRQSPVGVPIASSPLEGSSDYGVGVWLDQRDESGNLTGAIAAGARGFASWIDFDDEMVGCFATDLATPGNCLPLYYLLRDSAQDAVRAACIGDFNKDGGVDGEDVGAFFAGWENAVPAADVNRDGGIDGADVSAFFVFWSAGATC